MIQDALRSVLLADGNIEGLVGERVYTPTPEGLIPQGATMPAISIFRPPSGPRPLTLDGAKGIRPVRIQVDSWGSNYTQAWQVAKAVDDRLVGFSGPAGASERFNLVTQATAPGEAPEPDVKLFRIQADYFVVTASQEAA